MLAIRSNKIAAIAIFLALSGSTTPTYGFCNWLTRIFWFSDRSAEPVAQTPPAEKLFSSATRERRPRVVFTVGIPGSGKSSWVNAAKKKGWIVISNDEIRKEIILEMKAKGEKINLPNGSIEEPDVLNPAHLFSLPGIIDLSVDRFRDAAKLKRPVVMDANNLDFARAERFMVARQAGYSVEAIEFVTPDVAFNLNNVERRLAEGGHDILPGNGKSPNTSSDRLRKLEERLEQMNRNPLKQRSESTQNVQADSREDEMLMNDYVDVLYRVPVKDYSTP